MRDESARVLLFLLHRRNFHFRHPKEVFTWRQKPYSAIDALTAVVAMEADEATTNTSPAGQEAAPMAGSTRAASVGRDKKLKAPNKVLTK
jgi:hypothetical protein